LEFDLAKSLVETQFGAHAAAYATSDVHAKGESIARLVSLVAPQPGWRVLDIATGAGHTALAFAPRVAHVVACDMTQEMLDQTRTLAAARGIGNLETVRAAADALPFADASFDAVVCRLALHHFPEPARFFREAARVSKRSGVLGFVDNISPDAAFPPGMTADCIEEVAVAYNAFERLRDPSHGRALLLDELTKLAGEAGFEVSVAERAAKPMAFLPWAARMGCDAATTARLDGLLRNGPKHLREFLMPHQVDGELWFTLQEGIIRAVKR